MVINSIDRSRSSLRMTMGFSNVEVIGDCEKSTFIGEVKARSLTRMRSSENVREQEQEVDNSRSFDIKGTQGSSLVA